VIKLEGMTLEKLQVIIEAYTKPYRDEMEKVKKQTTSTTSHVERQTSKMASSFRKIAGVVVAALSITALIAFGKSCIQLGSDLAEVQNVVDVTFGSMSKQVDAFSKNAITQFGLSELTAKKYMGTYGAMAKSFGVTGEAGYQMSAAITGLTGDVASFYNLSTDEAYTKLKSIFTGETESLKELGVVMTQTALDQYALSNGYGKTTAKMTEQEKVMLRYQFVMSSLSDASGDFARTSKSWANQVRVLQLQFQSLKATIGQGLINAFTPVIQVINTVLARLQTLASYFKAFTVALFGDAGGSSDALSDTAESSGTVADNLSDAADSAKKLKDYSLGIDELNVLNADDSSGSGSGTGSDSSLDFGSMSGELFSDVTVNPAIEEAAQRVKDLLEAIKTAAEPTREALQRLWDEGFAKLGTFVWTGLKDFYNEFLVPLGKWTLGTGIPMFADAVNDFLLKVDWQSINDALKNFWKALEPFAENVGTGLLKFFRDLLDVGASFINTIIPGGLNGIASALKRIDPDQAESIGYGIGLIATSLSALKLVWTGFKGADNLLKFLDKLFLFIATPSFGITLTLAIIGGTVAAYITALDKLKEYKDNPVKVQAEWEENKEESIKKNKWGMGNRYAQQADATDAYLNDNAYVKQFEYIKTKLHELFNPDQETLDKSASNIMSRFGQQANATEFWKKFFSPDEDTIKKSANNTMSRFGQQMAATEFWTEVFNKFKIWCSQKWDGVEIWYNTNVAPWFTAEKWNSLYDPLKTSLKKKWDETVGVWGSDIQIWWDDKVSPWFTRDKWNSVYEGIKTSLKNTWDSTVSQWSADVSSWWGENVSPWFTAQKWSELYKTIKEELKSTWDNTAGVWKTDIDSWWNKNVSPWFTIQKWSDLYESIKTQLKQKWTETSDEWRTNLTDWWDVDVSPWFTLKKWLNLYDSVKSSLKTKWNDTVEVWKTDLGNWWTNDVSPWFTLKQWTDMMARVPDAFRDIFKAAVNAAREQFNKLIDWLNDKFYVSFDGLEIGGIEVFPAFDVQLFTIPHIPALADGGMLNAGQLFIANEAGPELVGKYGSKSGVVNNDQIVDAVSEGVAVAVANVMTAFQDSGSSDSSDINLVVDGRTLATVQANTQKRSGFSLRRTRTV